LAAVPLPYLLSARLPRYSFAIQNAFQKVWARPQARPENFFSTFKFSIADWKGGMGHGFEKFIQDYALDTQEILEEP